MDLLCLFEARGGLLCAFLRIKNGWAIIEPLNVAASENGLHNIN